MDRPFSAPPYRGRPPFRAATPGPHRDSLDLQTLRRMNAAANILQDEFEARLWYPAEPPPAPRGFLPYGHHNHDDDDDNDPRPGSHRLSHKGRRAQSTSRVEKWAADAGPVAEPSSVHEGRRGPSPRRRRPASASESRTYRHTRDERVYRIYVQHDPEPWTRRDARRKPPSRSASRAEPRGGPRAEPHERQSPANETVRTEVGSNEASFRGEPEFGPRYHVHDKREWDLGRERPEKSPGKFVFRPQLHFGPV